MNIGSGTARIRSASLMVATGVLSLAIVTPVLGGTQCALQATVGGGSATEVEVGEEVLIEGFGFPSTTDVDLVYDVDGTPIGGETVTTDASGLFGTTVTPAVGEEGTWTVTATVIKGCSAETGFLVVAGPTPTPSPTPTPAPTATPQAALPDAAVSPPGHSNPGVLIGLLILGASVWFSTPLLARRLR